MGCEYKSAPAKEQRELQDVVFSVPECEDVDRQEDMDRDSSVGGVQQNHWMVSLHQTEV